MLVWFSDTHCTLVVFFSQRNVSTGIEATEALTSSYLYRKSPNTSIPSVYLKATEPDTPSRLELQERWKYGPNGLCGTVVTGETLKVQLKFEN